MKTLTSLDIKHISAGLWTFERAANLSLIGIVCVVTGTAGGFLGGTAGSTVDWYASDHKWTPIGIGIGVIAGAITPLAIIHFLL